MEKAVRQTAERHRAYVLEDVDTARALVGEHRQDAQRVDQSASGTHLYPCEWPCPRWVWAIKVLAAYDRGEIVNGAVPASGHPEGPAHACGSEQRHGVPADGTQR